MSLFTPKDPKGGPRSHGSKPEPEQATTAGDTRHRSQAEQASPAGIDTASGAVRGERSEPSVTRAASLQSRVSGILAMGLILALGIGVLTWYYSNTLSRQSHARAAAKTKAAQGAQGEVELPSLGRIDPPPPQDYPLGSSVDDPALYSANATEGTPYPQALPPMGSYKDLPKMPETYLASVSNPSPAPSGPAVKTPAELALERRLSGVAFARSTQSVNLRAVEGESGMGTIGQGSFPPGVNAPGASSEGPMAALLKPTVTSAARAQVLPTQRLLLPKGTFIDCTLETAIDSTLPGMTTCITATDTFGVDGTVVLLERGTKLFGETRGQVRQGASRLFVLWSEARTPTGVVVALDSPGTDELGRSGLSGEVNRHFWDRFGAAILISTIDSAIQSTLQSSGSGGTIIYNPTSSRDIMTEVLKGTIDIPPTIVKHQGDRIQVLVARDLDFRSVYELRSSLAAR